MGASLHVSADTVHVTLAGVFDAETAFVLQAALAGAATARLDVVVNVARTRFADSVAARTLVKASIDVHLRSRRLTLRGLSPWTAAAIERATYAVTSERTG
jgi:anti-anti-sigma regulatory factor